ncbi:MAG: GNAT family N-acetyltransferase [Gammaproteobacteria bacterium]|jgi:tRNA(Met) cytidine acetyltransferase|nr:GNAT family N-acetyltransferase [Gammaproteobacteria bacterium]
MVTVYRIASSLTFTEPQVTGTVTSIALYPIPCRLTDRRDRYTVPAFGPVASTSPLTSPVLSSLSELLAAVAASGERRLLWLAGPADWTLAAAEAVAAALALPDTRWLGSRGSVADPNRRTSGLGGECGLLVVDAWAGLDLDALGAAAGTLRGGGLLVLLTPPAADWPAWTDPAAERFASFPHGAAAVTGRLIRRLCGLLDASPAVRRVDGPAVSADAPSPAADTAGHGLGLAVLRSAPRATPTATGPTSDLAQTEAATPDQAKAVAAILATAKGRPHRPLAITADRGRGKSAAMGLAAARLQVDGHKTILLTAPRRAAAEAVLRHAGGAAPRFLAPDALLAESPPADLLLVDEAAAIPAPLLETMLTRYPRIVFATTVHGYEGTGRGFEVRFRAVLDRLTPGWRALRLSRPIRWAPGDPLEALLDQALLLDAEPAADADAEAALATVGPAGIRFETPERDALAGDESRLRQAFGLLVLGHYQTRPSDLRQLLDAPGIAVHWLRAGETLLAVAVSGREGRLDAPGLDCRRILRIAVHPAVQRRGLGRRLLADIASAGADEGADLLGASFGATPELIGFWRGCGLVPVHIGSRRNAASGAHAAVVLRALTAAGGAVLQRGRERLVPRLAVLLAGPLRDLEPAVVVELLAAAPSAPVQLDDLERRELLAFANADRGLDATRPALHRLLQVALPGEPAADIISRAQRHALIACVLQHADPGDCAEQLGCSGAAAVVAELRTATAALLAAGGRQPSPD